MLINPSKILAISFGFVVKNFLFLGCWNKLNYFYGKTYIKFSNQRKREKNWRETLPIDIW